MIISRIIRVEMDQGDEMPRGERREGRRHRGISLILARGKTGKTTPETFR